MIPRSQNHRARPAPERAPEPGSRRSRRVVVICAVAVVAAPGCSRSIDGEFLVRDSAGVSIAMSRAPAWGMEPAWRLTEPSVVIRGADGEPFPLTRVTDAHRFADGRILILDGGASELRFHDATGRHLRTVGGPGRGPGEYRSLDGIAVIDDSLWIYDQALGRVSVLDHDGRYARSFRLEPTGDPRRPLRRYRLAGSVDGGLVLMSRSLPASGPPSVRPAVENLLYSRRGFLVDSIAAASTDNARGQSDSPLPLEPGPVRPAAGALANGLLYESDPKTLQVAVYDHHSGLRRIIRAETTSLPELKPAYAHRVVVSEGGRVWIQKYTRGRNQGPADWLVFDSDGRWLGVVESPRREDIISFEIHQVGPWGALAVWRDRHDTEHVGVWGITG